MTATKPAPAKASPCASGLQGRERLVRSQRNSSPKRYDPAYERFQKEAGTLAGARLLRVTTLESPFQPYIQHYPLQPPLPAPEAVLAGLRAETDASIRAAIGDDADDFLRRIYQMVLLDTLVQPRYGILRRRRHTGSRRSLRNRENSEPWKKISNIKKHFAYWLDRWNLPEGWVISARPAHPPLVSEADFIAVQGIRAVRDGTDSDRCYLLAGLLRCGVCGRRLESCWANNRAAYRCRHGQTSAIRPDPNRPRNL